MFLQTAKRSLYGIRDQRQGEFSKILALATLCNRGRCCFLCSSHYRRFWSFKVYRAPTLF
ncbi:hypothetical protein ACTXT7_013043 [Hymenolepis weldensis]